MKHTLWIALIISTVSLHGCATTSPTHSLHAAIHKQELVRFGIPEDWVQAFRTQNGNMLITEYVPKGETVADWKEMITMQTFIGGLNTTANQFAGTMRAGWLKACPGGSAFPGRNGKENGYNFAFWLQSCGNNPKTKQPEITLLKVIQGNDNFYVMQKAWKYMPEKNEVTKWSRYMRTVVVCDSRIEDRKCPL